MLRFGPPAAEFEAGRIFSWRLVERGERLEPARPMASRDFPDVNSWSNVRYSLVVVFDGQALAQRYSLIAVRPSRPGPAQPAQAP